MVSNRKGKENIMDINKTFDMAGYDMMALVNSVTDDYVRYYVLHNSSGDVLVAEAHAESEPTADMQEPGRLVAAYPYIGDHDWRVAYKLALADAVRRAHAGDDSCSGCGCLPGDGRTAGCTDPDGCGYFTGCEHGYDWGRCCDRPRTVPVSAADVDAAAEHDIDTRMAELHDIANHVEPRD